MACKHPSEDRHSALLRLRVGTAETDQTSRAMLTCEQSAEMCSHIAQVATGRKGCPLFLRWNLQAFLAIMRVEEAPDGLAILLNERSRIELGIDHHCVERCVTEEGLNNVHGRVVIQMFGGENAPAIVRQQRERRAVRALSSGADRKAANAIADGLKSPWCWDVGCPGEDRVLAGGDASREDPSDRRSELPCCCRTASHGE